MLKSTTLLAALLAVGMGTFAILPAGTIAQAAEIFNESKTGAEIVSGTDLAITVYEDDGTLNVDAIEFDSGSAGKNQFLFDWALIPTA